MLQSVVDGAASECSYASECSDGADASECSDGVNVVAGCGGAHSA